MTEISIYRSEHRGHADRLGATTFKDGVVVAQVNEIVEKVPPVDIPGDRVRFVVKADKPFFVEPLFTRDPAAITVSQILAAMLAIKGVYAP